jgi:hypothetical protein
VRSILQGCEQWGYRLGYLLVEKALKNAPDDLEQEENKDKASYTKKEEE